MSDLARLFFPQHFDYRLRKRASRRLRVIRRRFSYLVQGNVSRETNIPRRSVRAHPRASLAFGAW
jgi:hypothetical protein